MARLPLSCPAGFVQHVIQPGNNRSICFAGEQDFSAYANWLKDYSIKFEVAVHSCGLMGPDSINLYIPKCDDNTYLNQTTKSTGNAATLIISFITKIRA